MAARTAGRVQRTQSVISTTPSPAKNTAVRPHPLLNFGDGSSTRAVGRSQRESAGGVTPLLVQFASGGKWKKHRDGDTG